MRGKRWGVLAAAALVLPSQAMAFEPRVSRDAFGINVQALGHTSAANAELAMGKIAELGVGSARIPVGWNVVDQFRYGYGQNCDGYPVTEPTWVPNWGPSDQMVRAAALVGVRPRLTVMGSPCWTLSAAEREAAWDLPNDRHHTWAYLPRGGFLDDWEDWIERLVQRYGPGGTFWSLPANSDLPPGSAVRDWEIWNEANSESFARPSASGTHFGVVYDLAADKITTLDSGALVMVGGLDPTLQTGLQFGEVMKYEIAQFLDNMSQSATIDAVAIHPYGKTVTDMMPVVRHTRAWLDANVMDDVRLHLNEWGAHGPTASDGISHAARGQLFGEAAQVFLRSDCGVAELTPHTWMASPGNSTDEAAHAMATNYTQLINGENGAPGPAQAFSDSIARQMGETLSRPAQATVHLCDRPNHLPDQDGDTVPDERDVAPMNPNLQTAPQASAPAVYESPALRHIGRYGESNRLRVGQSIATTDGTWDGSPLPTFDVLRWESCDAGGAACLEIPGTDSATLALPEALYGRTVRPVVRATNSQGTSTAVGELSERVGDVPRTVTHGTIYGQQKVFSTVNVANWVVSDIPAKNQPTEVVWKACEANGTTCPTILGTGTSLTIPLNALNKKLRVDIWVRNVFGTAWAGRIGQTVTL